MKAADEEVGLDLDLLLVREVARSIASDCIWLQDRSVHLHVDVSATHHASL